MKKNIFITGVSKGLGLQICKVLLQNDFIVYGVSRTKTEELVDLENKYSNLIHINFDLFDLENIKISLFTKYSLNSIPFHGFVNNAAIAYDDIITNINFESLQKMYRLNVFCPLIITKLIIRNMLLHGVKGSIVHISSISAHTGYKGLAMYASTKGALEAFSKNTAREWGSKKIRSNCVVAGFMDTEMSSSLTLDQKNRVYNRTSLKSPTSPYSIAQMVNYLLSDDSCSVTGQSIFVDSGTI